MRLQRPVAGMHVGLVNVPAKPDPEDPITASESGALDLLLIDIELLAKCGDF